MARVGLGSLLAAGGAGAYGMQQLSANGPSNLWGMLPKDWNLPSGGAGQPGQSGGSDLSALQLEMRRLSGMVGDIARNGNRPTVVQLGGRNGWSVLVVPVLVGGTVLYFYCRLTGTSVWDMFYVSGSSLKAFRSTVQEGMSKMWEEMKKQKEEIFKVVGTLGKKQDELKDQQGQLMTKQDQMDDRLRRVDDACYALDSKANHTITKVDKLDNRLQDVHTGVQAANQGIFMLVSAVSEITQKIGLHNSRTAQALKGYAHSGPAWQVSAPPSVPQLTAAASSATSLPYDGESSYSTTFVTTPSGDISHLSPTSAPSSSSSSTSKVPQPVAAAGGSAGGAPLAPAGLKLMGFS